MECEPFLGVSYQVRHSDANLAVKLPPIAGTIVEFSASFLVQLVEPLRPNVTGCNFVPSVHVAATSPTQEYSSVGVTVHSDAWPLHAMFFSNSISAYVCNIHIVAWKKASNEIAPFVRDSQVSQIFPAQPKQAWYSCLSSTGAGSITVIIVVYSAWGWLWRWARQVGMHD